LGHFFEGGGDTEEGKTQMGSHGRKGAKNLKKKGLSTKERPWREQTREE